MTATAGALRAARDWLAARRQQPRLRSAEEAVKAGNLKAAIAIYEDLLPKLKDKRARAQALRQLVKIRVQLAERMRRAGKTAACGNELRSMASRLEEEIGQERITAGGSAVLVAYAVKRLERYDQLDQISAFRPAPPVHVDPRASATERLEAVATGAPGSSADACSLVAEIRGASLPLAWWLAIHERLYRRGFVAAAVEAKRAAAEAVLHQRRNMPAGALHLSAALCLDDAEQTRAIIDAVRDPVLKRDGLLALGDVDGARAQHARLQSSSDRRFAAWIGPRSVAVVGPAENDLGNGAAIDGHDLVIRTNFIVNDAFRASASMLGTRTDAVYYNTIFLEKREQDIAQTLRQGRVAFAMLRSPLEQMRVAWQARGQRTRAYPFTPAVFMARGYAMRHILNDLALLPGVRISCFGSDFFLGSKSHFSGYSERRHAFDHAGSYVAHDPIDCWRFMRTLEKAGLISGDAVLTSILRLDEAEFLSALGRRIAGDLA